MTLTGQQRTLVRPVGAEGNVTYSDQLPEDAVQTKSIEIDQGPSAEEVRQAETRIHALEYAVQAAGKTPAPGLQPRTATSLQRKDSDVLVVYTDSEERREVLDAEPRQEVLDAGQRKEVP